MRYHVTVGEHTCEVEVERSPDGAYRVRPEGGPELNVTAQTNAAGLLDLSVNGQNVRVLPSEGEVRYRQEHYAVRTESWLQRSQTGSGAGNVAQSRKVLASMPGRIIEIACQVGQAVTMGAPLLVMEAMKMQNELSAKSDGVVRAISVAVGQNVERGELLIEFE